MTEPNGRNIALGHFEQRLRAGRFVVTAEITPPVRAPT